VPVGWYPTGVMFSGDARRIYVLSGKGLASGRETRADPTPKGGCGRQYTANMLPGAISVIDAPDPDSSPR